MVPATNPVTVSFHQGHPAWTRGLCGIPVIEIENRELVIVTAAITNNRNRESEESRPSNLFTAINSFPGDWVGPT